MPTVDLGLRVRLDRARVTDHLPHKEMVNVVTDKSISSIMRDIATFTKPDGTRMINPRVRVGVTDVGITFDLIGDLVDNATALNWMTNGFDSTKFRNNLASVINTQMTKWAKQSGGPALFADDKRIWQAQD